MSDIPKAYNPKTAEEKWYPFWENHGFFYAKVDPTKKPYTIVIPPPNITGILTMGHVLNCTIQDVFVRWKRMHGYETLWMPGTDHAGIATQNVVEKSLLKEGKTRHDLGREEFLKRVWQWKKEYGGTIIKQLKELGTSCDWSRECFTMDEGLSEAVQEIFIRLYKKGLIYRGKYIINWCPKDHTAISDDEVNFVEQHTNLWYINYPIKDLKEYAVIATTRPETMLGDTAVAVHPKDERYKHLIGRTAILPLTNREIPIISDEYIDPNFGTGMVKVTPAHDPNDYWIGERHNAGIGQRHQMVPMNILDESARLNENVPQKYQGMDHLDARKEVVKDLEALGLLQKTVPYVHNIGRCYRCDTIIQPYLSDQWFVKMKPLAEKALQVVLNEKIKFHPDRWVKTYEHWMKNIRDWCISRQLWWGHRIPVWYCVGDERCLLECKEPIVSKTKPNACPHCGSKNLRQDEDVLDTWFSSWLWPFSTLGWPRDNPDLRYFYPTGTLVTAPDIIFFWVARMIMAGLEVMDGIPKPDGSTRNNIEEIVPFKDVYFTSIIRDAQGRKMSKSLGNSPDPLDVIKEYGADALRYTIVYLAPLGQDVLYSNEKCEIGRNFANKVWNAGRFLLMNKEQLKSENKELRAPSPGRGGERSSQTPNHEPQTSEAHLDLADRWIFSRLHSTISDLNDALEDFEINQATKILYGFIWHDFCDWYVEMLKSRLYGDESVETKQHILSRALEIFDQALRMLHPFMPFVTEELWQHLDERKSNESIMIATFPVQDKQWIDKKSEEEMAFVQMVIESVRNVRGELTVPPSREISIIINFQDGSKREIIKKYQSYFQRLARVSSIEELKNGKRPNHSASAVVSGGEVFIPLEGIIDLDAERLRIRKELNRVQGMLEGIQKKLSNENFVGKAPKEVVDKEWEKLESFKVNLEKLKKNLDGL
ncbi:MAG TPA: valine--tRNA ligase [Bacteroidota bacterium]|nr:valine--tRNA ligase [Bacteroidota bacterium]